MDRVELLDLMRTTFSDDEIRDVCFELNVDYHSLPAEGKAGKIRELIQYLERRGRMNELVAVCERLRPHMNWACQSVVASLSGSADKIKILFLAANPIETSWLRLDQEIREIDASLRQAEFRDRFEIKQHLAVRVNDLQECLLRHKPDIVHFSGHGSQLSEIVLEDDTGNSFHVSVRALARLFSVLKDKIRCVVLNACYSERQAKAIAQNIDCVVGMSKAIGDSAAISFAAAFYQALGYGRDIKTAFDLGCVRLDLEDLGEQDTPKLIAIKSDPEKVVFVHN